MFTKDDICEIATKQEQTHDNSKEADGIDAKIISAEHPKDIQHSQQVAEAAEVADVVVDESTTPASMEVQEGEQQIPDSIYRAYGDTWKCHNCNAKGDRWFMIKHPQYCRESQSKPKSGGSK
jgi:hypothetical protein